VTGRRFVVILALGLAMAPRPSAADELDEAFARGNAAAAEARWGDAIVAYEQARAIVPGRAPLLSYNLGTAYAHAGELGHATYYLQRVLASDHGNTPDVVEASRRNLALVRRRLEVEAEGSDARLSQADDWRDAVVAALGSALLAWLTVVAGWAALGVTLLRRRIGEISTPISIALWAVFAIGFLGYSLASTSDRAKPGAVVVDTVTVRAGPGMHHAPEFELNRGSRVLVDDQRSTWALVRLPSQLTGWIPSGSVAAIAGEGPTPRTTER
jgi:hypothetical protein